MTDSKERDSGGQLSGISSIEKGKKMEIKRLSSVRGRFGLFSLFLTWIMLGPLLATDYRIQARLDTDTKIIQGTATITWINRASVPVEDLRFHLYYNAWRDAQSSFLTSNRVSMIDFSDWKDDEWAYNEIDELSVSMNDNSELETAENPTSFDLTDSCAFIQPDDENSDDRTVLRAVLPRPAQPDETLVIKVGFRTKVPRPFARTGYRGDYYFLAHWFPKLGVIESDGQWNCHQFIQTEFFSDFGTYDVSLTVPAGWIVGATGKLVAEDDNPDGTATHTFHQEKVHAFTWTTSPHFLEHRKRFEHPSLRAVDMRLLLMPDHAGQEKRYFRATEAALRLYGEWFGAYPYGHVTVVDPAYKSRSGGMEYPTLFTGGSRWLSPEGSGSPEGVTVHECGHQFWYGLVANNEFEHAWLDEGFNTYSTGRVMEKEFSPRYLVRRYLDNFVPVLFRDLQQSPRSVAGLGGNRSALKLDIMSKPSWQSGPAAFRRALDPGSRVYSGGAYGVNSYTKPAMMLQTLERYLGWETFQRIMATYFERNRFGHPGPEDYFNTVAEISGQDLQWFWDETFNSSDVFDYAVDSVVSRDNKKSVVIRRWGEATFPVQIRVTFENGDQVLESWDGIDRWIRYSYSRPEEIQTVEVDPSHVLALDINRTNNTWLREAPSSLAAAKWSFKWMIWLQSVLEGFAFHI